MPAISTTVVRREYYKRGTSVVSLSYDCRVNGGLSAGLSQHDRNTTVVRREYYKRGTSVVSA